VGGDLVEFGEGLGGEGGVAVGDHNLRAFAGEADGGSSAYAGGSAGDEGDFVLQSTGHGQSPSRLMP